MRGSHRIVRLVLAAGLSAAAAHSASAAMMTGRDLVGQCNSGSDLCSGYVVGIIDQWGWFETHIDQIRKCRPQGITTGDIVGIAKTYLAEHPEKLSEPAPALVEAAFVSAFTC